MGVIKGDPAELVKELSDMAWDAVIAAADDQEPQSVEAFMDIFEGKLLEVFGLRLNADDEQPDDNS